MQTMTFKIQGMTTGACIGRVFRALEIMEGISDPAVSLRHAMATVTTDASCVSTAQVEALIARLGFRASIHSSFSGNGFGSQRHCSA
ncbi:hypothetical protein BH11PSE12_BH11PSE12_00560 [soil metagenome]